MLVRVSCTSKSFILNRHVWKLHMRVFCYIFIKVTCYKLLLQFLVLKKKELFLQKMLSVWNLFLWQILHLVEKRYFLTAFMGNVHVLIFLMSGCLYKLWTLVFKLDRSKFCCGLFRYIWIMWNSTVVFQVPLLFYITGYVITVCSTISLMFLFCFPIEQ